MQFYLFTFHFINCKFTQDFILVQCDHLLGTHSVGLHMQPLALMEKEENHQKNLTLLFKIVEEIFDNV